jgi:hypothetical protein
LVFHPPHLIAIKAKPPNEKEFHLLWFQRLRFGAFVHNHGMEYTNNATIPVRVWIITGEDHDVAMGAWVDGILGASSIVRGVIYP